MRKYLLVGGPLDGQYYTGDQVKVSFNIPEEYDPSILGEAIDPCASFPMNVAYYGQFEIFIGGHMNTFLVHDSIREQEVTPKLIAGYKKDDKADKKIKRLERQIQALEHEVSVLSKRSF